MKVSKLNDYAGLFAFLAVGILAFVGWRRGWFRNDEKTS